VGETGAGAYVFTAPGEVRDAEVGDKRGRNRGAYADAQLGRGCRTFQRRRLTLTSDVGTLTVYGGGVTAIFVLTRTGKRGKPLIQLTLVGGDFSVCTRALASVAKGRPPPKKTVRRLWANGKGSFRTRGRYASATIRGTIWLTADRCDGTLVFVQQGKVDVFD